jgi:hypothetical protein
MFLKCLACFLFLDPQDWVGLSIFSSVVLCFFVLLVVLHAVIKINLKAHYFVIQITNMDKWV